MRSLVLAIAALVSIVGGASTARADAMYVRDGVLIRRHHGKHYAQVCNGCWVRARNLPRVRVSRVRVEPGVFVEVTRIRGRHWYHKD